MIVEDFANSRCVTHHIVGQCTGIESNRPSEVVPMRIFHLDRSLDATRFVELHIEAHQISGDVDTIIGRYEGQLGRADQNAITVCKGRVDDSITVDIGTVSRLQIFEYEKTPSPLDAKVVSRSLAVSKNDVIAGVSTDGHRKPLKLDAASSIITTFH